MESDDQSPILKALVIEGGAMRSVFSAGLLDGFLQAGFNPFDLYIGVSGGACNLLSYLSAKQSSAMELYKAVASDRQFISYRRFFMGGSLIDIDWLIDYLFSNHPSSLSMLPLGHPPFLITTTDVSTGQPGFVKATTDNLREAMTASMSLPLLHRSFPMVEGTPRTDGGVAANIPVEEAINRGANRIMVVRSRPREFKKRDTLWHQYIRYKLRHYEYLADTMKRRVEQHQRAVAILQSPPAGVHIVDICPPASFRGGRFCRNPQTLQQGYDAGVAAAEPAMREWADITVS